jgi:hypothetical protein
VSGNERLYGGLRPLTIPPKLGVVLPIARARFGERQRYRSFNAILVCPANARPRAAVIGDSLNIGKFSPIVKFDPVSDLKLSAGSTQRHAWRAHNPSDFGSPRPKPGTGSSARRPLRVSHDRRYEQESTAELVTAVVTDVGFRHHSDIDRQHRLLSKPRALAAPIVAILRDNSYLQRVQAAAVGATFLFSADVSVSDIFSALAVAEGHRVTPPSGSHTAWRRA